jgi:radical SAM protein with 4Fe4S-binding SPASM domain
MEHAAINTARCRTATMYESADSRRISRLISSKRDPNEVIAEQVGPRYWEYRLLWDMARTFQLRPPFPIHVDYELSFKCNLKCPICLMSLPPDERSNYGNPAQTLSLETVKGLIDEGAAKGQMAVGLNGICEPLLSPDLAEIVRYAREMGMLDVMFNTNGLLLDAAVARELVHAGLTRVMISLDAATQDTYDKIRVGSDFETVCRNIRQMVDIRNRLGKTLPIIRVSFCVTSLNEHELDDFIDQWQDTVDFFSIQQYGNTFDESRIDDGNRLFPKDHPYHPDQTPRCGQPWKRVMIRHNGSVMPCCDASGLSLSMGNIYKQSLEDVWLGPNAEAMRCLHQNGRYDRHPVCRRCMTKWGVGHA